MKENIQTMIKKKGRARKEKQIKRKWNGKLEGKGK